MRYLLLSLLFLFSFNISGQENTQVNTFSSSLNPGETLDFGNKSIKFKNVVSDSRCPKDVTCVWAGEAIIAVEIYEGGKYIGEKEISVATSNIPLQFSSEENIYSISKLVLTPYPSVSSKNISNNYVLHLSVSETFEI